MQHQCTLIQLCSLRAFEALTRATTQIIRGLLQDCECGMADLFQGAPEVARWSRGTGGRWAAPIVNSGDGSETRRLGK